MEEGGGGGRIAARGRQTFATVVVDDELDIRSILFGTHGLVVVRTEWDGVMDDHLSDRWVKEENIKYMCSFAPRESENRLVNNMFGRMCCASRIIERVFVEFQQNSVDV
jgi:hypothetical protein